MMSWIRKTNLFALLVLGVFLAASAAPLFISALRGKWGTFLFYGMAVCLSLLFCAVNREDPVSFFGFRAVPIRVLCMITVLAVVMVPLINLLNYMSALFVSDATARSITEEVGTYPGMIWPLLLIAAVPALVEETVYRGAVLGGYRKEDRSFRAIAASAFLFALLHMNFNQMSYAFVIGLILGTLVALTGSVWSSIWLHFCINGMSVISVWNTRTPAADSGTPAADSGTPAVQSDPIAILAVLIPPAVISLILTLVLIYWIARVSGTMSVLQTWFFGEDGYPVRRKRQYIDVWFVLITIFCLAFAIISEFPLT